VKFRDVHDIFAASVKHLEISLYTADSKRQGRCAKWNTKLYDAPTVSGSSTRLPRSTAAKRNLAPQIERLVAAISDPEMLELNDFFVDGDTTSAAKLLAGVRANIAREPTAFAGMRDFVCSVDSLPGKKAKISIELKFHELSVELFSRGDDADAPLVEPGDINQGSLGDCYFLSALAVLSTREELLFSVFPDAQPSDLSLGAFGVRFWRDGAWRIVVVDAKMPTHARRAKELGFGFALVWGRAVAPDVGAHMHGLVCWPAEHIDVLIDLFASVTGSDVSDDPFDPSNPNEQAGDIRSYCRGWLLRWGKFGLGGALRFSDYIAEQDEKFPELQTLAGRCFGNSNAIGHSERRKAGW
jgi:hypothetical protein